MVKKIVEEHGGIIWAENNPKGGAVITVRLPVHARHREERRNDDTPRPLLNTEVPQD